MNTEDLIRLKKYRQIKDAIRGSDQHMIVGIDIAKDKHHAFVGTVTGQTLLRRLIFENTIDGFRKFLAHVEAIGDQNRLEETIFGLEPTGNYHKPLGSHLIRCDKNIVLVSGVAVRHNRELLAALIAYSRNEHFYHIFEPYRPAFWKLFVRLYSPLSPIQIFKAMPNHISDAPSLFGRHFSQKNSFANGCPTRVRIGVYLFFEIPKKPFI